MKLIFTALIFFSLLTFAFAQTDSTDSMIEELLEDSSQDLEEAQNLDLLEYLMKNPIRINSASINDLESIPYLTHASAAAIIRYRNLRGGIYSADELKSIESVSGKVIEKILPFIFFEKEEKILVTNHLSIDNIKFSYRFRVMNDLQERKAFEENKYPGSPQKYYNRFLFGISNKIGAGVLIEKDAGEKSLSDFYAFHLNIKEIGFAENFIAGDFVYEFGQGLAMWGPYSFSKGSDAIGTVTKNGRHSVPYLSADENQFFRGSAVKINFNNLSFSPFYSYRFLDASIDTNTNMINSLSLDGYHRTNSEILKKDAVTEKVFGISAQYFFSGDSKIGLLYYNSRFNKKFEETYIGGKPVSNFELLSAAYSVSFNKLFLSGEFSYDKKSVSSINNAEFFIEKNLSFAFSFRNFPRNYFSLHGRSFGEKGTAQNETGFYAGCRFATEYGTINVYYDQFKFPVTSDSYLFPTKGREFLFYYTYKIFREAELRIRYKNKKKELVETINSELGTANRTSQNFRAEISYKADKNINMKSRIEYVTLTPTPNLHAENGYLIFQEIKYTPAAKLNIYARLTFFSTDSYNSRLYVFENDLTGVMSNPALYGEGLRWYLLASYETKIGMKISFKYSELYKPDEITLGSGDSEIDGNVDNKISLQLDFNF
ncbi:MAG: helix-hairpin-helix domain-containing protein [Ignavibacteriales bacterium]|nr:helix-hairpin-helix domain-containing protein [Ignavibacteriales bacterium]